MWYLRRKLAICFALSLRCNLSSAAYIVHPAKFLSQFGNPITVLGYSPSAIFFSSVVTSTNLGNADVCTRILSDNGSFDDENDGINEDHDGESLVVSEESVEGRSGLLREIEVILRIIRAPRKSCSQVRSRLEECGVSASPELVAEVLSQVQNDWEAAFTFFLWCAKQPGYVHSLREYHSIISILGKMRKFDTAWALIDEMRGVRTRGQSIVTPHTLLIMIRRYCAVHDVGKAINTFYAHKLFKFEIGMEEFQNFLSALCRYKNVKDAEHLLFCNEDVFPLNTKSFNIILNGWCNVICSPREGKRIWREMSERGVSRDVVSYASLISCYSKAREVNEVLKLFEQLKAEGIASDRKVYNAVIHALAKARLVDDACNLMKVMEEKGIAPNAVTYNSLIMPLCKADRLDEAREAFHEMLQRGLLPTCRTYHAFFRILRTPEEVFVLLRKMNLVGCPPSHDTCIMLIRKFCRWRQLDNVFKLWIEMNDYGLDHDRNSYNTLIHGLFLNGMLEEAYEYHQQMKEKDLLPEPKLEGILQAWASDRNPPDDCSKLASRMEVKARLNSEDTASE